MREILDVSYVHYAIDPVTREFTEDNVTMAVKAANKALDAAGMAPTDIDLICYGSAHQDQMPTASVRIQEALGIDRCDELSIHANCTSAYKALYLAHQLVAAGKNKNALVLSSNISSSELRAEYYNQPLVDRESLFLRWFLCDGSGAAVCHRGPCAIGRIRTGIHVYRIGGRQTAVAHVQRASRAVAPARPGV